MNDYFLDLFSAHIDKEFRVHILINYLITIGIAIYYKKERSDVKT